MDSNNKNWAIAIELLKKEEPAGAFFSLRRLAAGGDISAYAPLGYLYELGGIGIPREPGKAVYWYRRAVAEIDDEIAHAGLGRMYYNGVDGEKDFAKAFFHCTRAPNDPISWVLLGAMYHGGTAVGKDLDKARQYYARAIGLGYLLPLQFLGQLEMQSGHFFKGLAMRLRSAFLAGIIAYRNPKDERLQGAHIERA
jgi:TPR repeat protein